MAVTMWIILIVLFAIVAGAVSWFIAYGRGKDVGAQVEKERQESLELSGQQKAQRMITDAENEIQQRRLRLKEDEVESRKKAEAEFNSRQKELNRFEARLQTNEEMLDKRNGQ